MIRVRKSATSMMAGRKSLLLLGAVVAFSLTACVGNVAGPDTETVKPAVAGALIVQLDTPATNDGAVQLQFTGPGIDSVRASGYTGYGSSTSNSAQLIVTGQLHDGLIAKVYVHDVALFANYHVAIVAAAARGTYALQDLAGYSATITR